VRLPRLVGEGRALDIIMTGRKVEAEEAYRIGLANRIAPKHRSREVAEALAHEIARFPQACVRADRRSAVAQHGMPVMEALRQEWEMSVGVIETEGAAGAARFASGKGRHGDFGSI
jgi:enoyl-CoA hydratase